MSWHWGVLAFFLAACPSNNGQNVKIAAASSLSDVIPAFQETFDSPTNAGFAGSQVLRSQIESGADIDIFLSANIGEIRTLSDRGILEPPELIARNELVLAVPERSQLRHFRELDSISRLIIGTRSSPIGAYTESILNRAQMDYGSSWRALVDRSVVSRESNVRRIRAKLELGEADAAILYRSDVRGSSLRAISIPESIGEVAEIFVAVRPNPSQDVLKILSELRQGHATWTRFGFQPVSTAR